MGRGKRSNPKTKTTLLYVLLGVMVVAAFFAALHAWEERQYRLDAEMESRYSETGRPVVYLDGKKYVERKHLETFLLIGTDKLDSETHVYPNAVSNDQQSDFVLLAVLDREAERVIPLHINRDTMVSMRVLGVGGQEVGMATQQLALSHTYGSGGNDSCRNTVKAVSDFLFGIPIDHYLAFNLDTLAQMNDLVGGVPVEIRDDFSAVDPTLIRGETICLTGKQAMHYVSARGSMADSSNLARMERQRQYMDAFRVQLSRRMKESESFVTEDMVDVLAKLASDCTVNELSDRISEAADFDVADFETVPGEAVKGETFMEFYPDEQGLKDLVIRLFFDPYGD